MNEDPLAFFKGLKNACIIVIPFWLVVACIVIVFVLKVMK